MRYKGKFCTDLFKKKLGNLKQNNHEQTTHDAGDTGFPADEELGSCSDSINCCGDAPVRKEWLNGRRVVELETLINSLICSSCDKELSLKNIERETQYGLGSIYYIKCTFCGKENAVLSGKRHTYRVNGDGRNATCFDVNTKLAAAMIHAGVGEKQINSILAELNLPAISAKSLKKREREIGQTVELTAETSCKQAVQEEMDILSELKDNGMDAPVQVSSDGGWQRRGTGHDNNSLSGHVTVTGRFSKKCLSYSVAKKRCTMCQRSSKHGRKKKHSCRRNWSGSAKGMEPFLTIQSITKLKKNGMIVTHLAMDDDSTTFLRAKQAFPLLIKLSDRNHIVKNFTNGLFKLKGTHSMSNKVISYIKKCFSYAISQNQSDPVGIKASLSAIVPHAFGDHSRCNVSWCGYIKDPTGYRHSSLPYGRDLSGEELKVDLQSLIDKYTTDESVAKLSNLQSTNNNENMNAMIARKAPKSLHLSGSESLDYRIAATVSQKNDGHSYLCKVNENHGLSPGHHTENYLRQQDKVRARQSLFQNCKESKKRRFELKISRKSDLTSKEIQEGVTYESNVAMASGETTQSIQAIPDELVPPTITVNSSGAETIIFDLETTGLELYRPTPKPRKMKLDFTHMSPPAQITHIETELQQPDTKLTKCVTETGSNALKFENPILASDCEVIQIAAKHVESEDRFATYVRPAKAIPRKIIHITGIEKHGDVMYHNMVEVEAKTLSVALEAFAEWLQGYGNVVLVAHNAKFDGRVLMNAVKICNLEDIFQCIIGFGDTLPMFKQAFPDRGKKGYNQAVLVRDILQSEYDAHDAIEDVRTLGLLFLEAEKQPGVNLDKFLFSTEHVLYSMKRMSNEKENKSTYQPLKLKKLLSDRQITQLAGKGFCLNHLKLVYVRSGVDGLTLFLKNKISKSQQTSVTLAEYFRNTRE